MMKFIYQFDEKDPEIVITISAESTISEALEAFESFLRAAGYHIEEGAVLDFTVDEIVDGMN